MIRYVYIREEDEVVPDGACFAWFDTVTNTFLFFLGNHVWVTWEEFELDWIGEQSNVSVLYCKTDLERFRNLFPRST